MSERELVLRLLRCSLWGEELNETEFFSLENWARIVELAKEQTIFGLLFHTISKADLSKYTKNNQIQIDILGAISLSEYIKHQNKLVNKELTGFAKLCNESNLDYIVVKGQTVGALYNHPNLRMPGDIDFLIRGGEKQVSIFSRMLCVDIPEIKVEKEVSFKRNEITYELHTRLRGWWKISHQRIWDDLIEREWDDYYYINIDGQNVRTLSPTLNSAYVFIHLFSHFMREGVSLRQMCDWCMVLYHYREEIDRERLQSILKELDLFRAYKAFGVILVDIIGLPISYFPFEISQKDKRWKDTIINDIFNGGNFGKLNHRHKSTWGYKMDTFCVALRNSIKYYRLCPSEIGGMLPRLLRGNIRLLIRSVH